MQLCDHFTQRLLSSIVLLEILYLLIGIQECFLRQLFQVKHRVQHRQLAIDHLRSRVGALGEEPIELVIDHLEGQHGLDHTAGGLTLLVDHLVEGALLLGLVVFAGDV